MDLFSLLLVGHLVGDFLLQTSWMAEKKDKAWPPLLVHCLVYTAAVAVFALPSGGISLPAMAVIIIGHIIIDKTKFKYFWARTVSGSTGIGWLNIVQDQAWHILVLVAAVYLT